MPETAHFSWSIVLGKLSSTTALIIQDDNSRTRSNSNRLPFTHFSKLPPAEMAEYHSLISKYLNDIDLSSFDCVSKGCSDANCTNRAHQAEIDKLYSHVVSGLRSVTTDRFAQSKSEQVIKKSIPG